MPLGGLCLAELHAQVDNDTDISALRVGIDLILNTVQR